MTASERDRDARADAIFDDAALTITSASSMLRDGDSKENTIGKLEQMLNLVEGRMRGIAGDPTAFLLPGGGGYDSKMLTAWNALVNSCGKLLQQIEDMRTSDKRLGEALRDSVSTMGKAIAGPFGEELRALYADIETLKLAVDDERVPRVELQDQVRKLRDNVLKLTTTTTIRIITSAASVTLRTTEEHHRKKP